jgi:hypothetical protein
MAAKIKIQQILEVQYGFVTCTNLLIFKCNELKGLKELKNRTRHLKI